MKICILGNSHAASLKSGWDEIKTEYCDFQLTFFASRQRGLEALKLNGNRLIPQTEVLAKDIAFTSGGLDSIQLETYDVFLTYGLGLKIPSLDFRYSSAVKKQICQDIFDRSLAIRICRMIRRGSENPIYIGHNPQLAISNTAPETRVNKLNYLETLNHFNKELNMERAIIVHQPEETLQHQWFTEQKFSIGSRRLDVGDAISGQLHQSADDTHMNMEFGKLWLEGFFRILGKA